MNKAVNTRPKGRKIRSYVLSPSPSPLYQQIREYVLNQIKTKTWKPDMKIPSENELVEKLKVSRMTVNRALRELTNEGYLLRLQGVGTFVAHPKPQSSLLEIKSIADEIRSHGGVHSCDVHLLREEVASLDLTAVMGLPAGTSVYHSVIVHRDSGCAIALESRYINPSVAPGYLQQYSYYSSLPFIS